MSFLHRRRREKKERQREGSRRSEILVCCGEKGERKIYLSMETVRAENVQFGGAVNATVRLWTVHDEVGGRGGDSASS